MRTGRSITKAVQKVNKALRDLDLTLSKVSGETFNEIRANEPGVINLFNYGLLECVRGIGMLDAAGSQLSGDATTTVMGEACQQNFLRERKIRQIQFQRRQQQLQVQQPTQE